MEWIARNSPLNLEEMQNNALIQYDLFIQNGWTLNAICGMLGNQQAESGINPNAWQNYTVNYNMGYGLVQWTPATKYIDWAGVNYNSGNRQVERILWEVENEEQWLNKENMTFYEFTQSNKTPYELAMIFLRCYERPSDLNQPQRGTNANYWYEFLNGKPFPTKAKKMPLWFYLKRRL